MHRQTVRALLSFQTGGKDLSRSAQYLRAKADLTDQVTALEKLDVQSPAVIQNLTGTCIARDWSQLWVPNTLSVINNSQKFINWSVALFSCYRSVLRSHIELRDRAVRAVLIGDWDTARETVQTHQRVVGPSLWALTWLMVIAGIKAAA